nr:hypothetical protein [Tanacetum cinerariifolium]
MYNDYFGGQPSATVENIPPAQEPQVRQTSTASTSSADNIPIPTNSSSHATNIPITSQDVDELNPNAMVDGNTFVNPFAISSTSAAVASSSSQNVFNYAKENAHLKATYKNLFDSISVTRAQTKTKITSLQNELQCNIYKNAKLRTQLFKKVSDKKDNTPDSSKNTKFAKQPIAKTLPKIGVNNAKVIAPGMFRISLDKVSRVAQKVPNTVSASSRTKPITVSQPSVITKKGMNSNSNGLSSTGLDNTKTRRPQPRSNTKNDRVPSASKSSRSMHKDVKVEEYHRNVLLSKKNKHMLSACNSSKIDSPDVKSKVVCAKCKKCLNSVNHDVCLNNCVNGKKSRGKLIAPSGANALTSNTMEPKIKRFPNSTSLLG